MSSIPEIELLKLNMQLIAYNEVLKSINLLMMELLEDQMSSLDRSKNNEYVNACYVYELLHRLKNEIEEFADNVAIKKKLIESENFVEMGDDDDFLD